MLVFRFFVHMHSQFLHFIISKLKKKDCKINITLYLTIQDQVSESVSYKDNTAYKLLGSEFTKF